MLVREYVWVCVLLSAEYASAYQKPACKRHMDFVSQMKVNDPEAKLVAGNLVHQKSERKDFWYTV